MRVSEMLDSHRHIADGASLQARTDLLTGIRRHLEAAYPEEACGGLLGRVHGESVEALAAIPLENTRHSERYRRYIIGPDEVLALERAAEIESLQVIGFYHSHPDAPTRPSQFDREHAWPWYVYLVVSIEAGSAVEVRAWRLKDDRSGFGAVPVEERQALES